MKIGQQPISKEGKLTRNSFSREMDHKLTSLNVLPFLEPLFSQVFLKLSNKDRALFLFSFYKRLNFIRSRRHFTQITHYKDVLASTERRIWRWSILKGLRSLRNVYSKLSLNWWRIREIADSLEFPGLKTLHSYSTGISERLIVLHWSAS